MLFFFKFITFFKFIIEIYFIPFKIHPFKVSSIIFSIFTKLCIHS